MSLLPPDMEEALNGLRQTPRTLPQHLIYDAKGIKYFEKIKRLRSYYPARTETALIKKSSMTIAKKFHGTVTLVDYGGSSIEKALPLLIALAPVDYVAVDISGDALQTIEEKVNCDFPHHTFRVHTVERDFRLPFKIPDEAVGQLKVGLCAGLTLGNFERDDLLKSFKAMRETLGDGSFMLVGMDIVVDKEVVLNAYSTPYCASFTMNVLTRINREGGANFDTRKFKYKPVWEEGQSRIAMYLVSQCAQTVRIGQEIFDFSAGEKIHVVSSYRYPVEKFQKLIEKTGWNLVDSWADDDKFCAIHLLQAEPID